MNNVIDFINTNRDRYVDELKALPRHPQHQRAAAARRRRARVRRVDAPTRCGASACRTCRLIDTPGIPGRLRRLARRARARRRSCSTATTTCSRSIRSNLWESPPFEATVRDGEIYARGAADDKGQVFMHFKAIEAHLKQNGRLPVNIKFILEGEEEVGSRQPRRLRQGAQGRARRRRRRDLRLADVRSRHPVDLLRPARPRLLPDRSARHEERSALGLVRRRRRQPRHGAGADPGADEGRERPDQDSRLLRRRAGADARRSASSGSGCRSTRRATRRSSARRSCSARAATRRSSASGRGRRSRSTACSAASPAKARRR